MRSFIVRLWHPSDAADPARGLRGTVVHVGSGRSAVFSNAAALLDFLRDEQESPGEGATDDADCAKE